MSTLGAAFRPIPIPRPEVLKRDPAAQAFVLMRITFTVAPILFGIDKFANVLPNDWTKYLASQYNDILPGTAGDAMHIVGVVEILAGLVVLSRWTKIGSYVVSLWLIGIVANLLTTGMFYDLAVRDVELAISAFALAQITTAREDTLKQSGSAQDRYAATA